MCMVWLAMCLDGGYCVWPGGWHASHIATCMHIEKHVLHDAVHFILMFNMQYTYACLAGAC